jgi:hypothetical protein
LIIDRNLETNTELSDMPSLRPAYHPAFQLGRDEKPHVYTGVRVIPETIWIPSTDSKPPKGVHAVFDFESPSWSGWERSGPAWGDGPILEAPAREDFVTGATGQRFATSKHGGDAATGRVSSPFFLIDGPRITMKLGGGTDATKLRVELWVDGQIARVQRADTRRRDVADHAARRRRSPGQASGLVSSTTTVMGSHLDIDDVWIWQCYAIRRFSCSLDTLSVTLPTSSIAMRDLPIVEALRDELLATTAPGSSPPAPWCRPACSVSVRSTRARLNQRPLSAAHARGCTNAALPRGARLINAATAARA